MNETSAPPLEPREVRKIETDRQVCRIRFSPCGQFLFGSGYDSVIRRWDMTVDEPQQLDSLSGHRGWVQSLEFAPHGGLVYSIDSWGELRAWPYRDEAAKPVWSVESAHDGWIRDLAVSADGSLLATGGRDGFVRVWSAEDGSPVSELPQNPHDVRAVTFHPDGSSLVFGDLMGRIQHWDFQSGKRRREVTFEKMHYYDRIQDVPGVYRLQFIDEGMTLILAGGQPTSNTNHQGIPVIHQIDWETLTTKRTQELGATKDGHVFDLAWHPDGFFAVVTSGNPGAGQFLLIRPDEDKAFFQSTKMSNCHTLALHPDGSRIVVAATNRNSQGNGAVRDKDGNYVGNSSPLHVFSLDSE